MGTKRGRDWHYRELGLEVGFRVAGWGLNWVGTVLYLRCRIR